MKFLYYHIDVTRCGGTQEDKLAGDWKSLFKRVASLGRKIRSGVKT